MTSAFLFFYTPIGLTLWIIVAMWHLRRRHQIRDKSTPLYYSLLVIDGLGFLADVAANYSWASVILMDLPRFDRREITISQHMARINESWDRLDRHTEPSLRVRWSRLVAYTVCRKLNELDPSGHHC